MTARASISAPPRALAHRKAAVAELARIARGYRRGCVWHHLREREAAA